MLSPQTLQLKSQIKIKKKKRIGDSNELLVNWTSCVVITVIKPRHTNMPPRSQLKCRDTEWFNQFLTTAQSKSIPSSFPWYFILKIKSRNLLVKEILLYLWAVGGNTLSKIRLAWDRPEVAKPLLLHQDFLLQLIRIPRWLTTEHSECPQEGFTFKTQWKYWFIPGICFWQY